MGYFFFFYCLDLQLNRKSIFIWTKSFNILEVHPAKDMFD